MTDDLEITPPRVRKIYPRLSKKASCKKYNDSLKGQQASVRGWLKKYGLTLDQYQGFMDKQMGACAICGTSLVTWDSTKRPHIDHCHETGKVRGLLCHHCNVGVGFLKEDVDILDKAIKYLTVELE